MAQLSIPILLGTVRQGRESEKVARLILEHIAAHRPDMCSVLFDPREMDLPPDDEGTDLAARNPQWREAILAADGLIIVTPEYNHAFPGSLKRALDVLLKEYIHKPVGLVGASSGWIGGVRAVEALVPVVRELGLVATFTDLYFPRVQEAFAEDGSAKDERLAGRIAGFLEELAWMAGALRYGRENLKSRYHSIPGTVDQ